MKRYVFIVACVLSLSLGTSRAGDNPLRIQLEPGERVWGGRIADGAKMPFRELDSTSLFLNSGNQVQPLLLTSHGRSFWSNEPFKFRIEDNCIIFADNIAAIQEHKCGTSLKDAYDYACRTYFPPEGKLPPNVFFECPQYNTWIELQYNQNQTDVLEYARGIIRNGFPTGIIMIDDTWMEDYGLWNFHPGRFPDPKAMCRELHEMGFKLMLWVCPFVSPDNYQVWSPIWDGLIRKTNGEIYPVLWWNGYSASIDLSSPSGYSWFDGQLRKLMEDYGVDGFKFDAGDFNLFPSDAVTKGNVTAWEYCHLFSTFGDKYPYNEYRAAWKEGGKPLVQRLHDKSHSWEALQALIPEMMAANLMGYWFCCPDMIGGGSFASFLPGCTINQDLIVRSAQIHALMPMMQFSVAPWRILDKAHLDAILGSISTRENLLGEIKEILQKSAETGSPAVSPLEFHFPAQGLDEIKDQYMLGDKIMVAPMCTEGFSRTVTLPSGRWKADDGKIYKGGHTITIDVPLDRIPYFRKL